MNLENKVVLITGSTRGIGNSIARLFLENSAKVVICGSNIDNAKKAVESIKNDLNISDDNIMPVGLNMKDKESIKEVVESIINRFGKIDVLINNAGITSNVSLLDSTDEEFYEMFDINFFGVVSLTREVVKHMKETGGSIINTSSMVGMYGGRNQSAYSSSKFAINGLTKSLAKELGMYNIRVNAVAPGVVGTDMVKENVSEQMVAGLLRMTPLNKMAEPSDLAGAYLYLASDLSKFTTGTIIQVDGGLVM
jgi:3-oxoacyl-[acyl-carrier protein] reductase/7-alpha-hydroxysteroid dehydrogenase